MATKAKEKPAENEARDEKIQRHLSKTLIAPPLMAQMNQRAKLPVVIDLSFNHCQGLPGAKLQACQLLMEILDCDPPTSEKSLDAVLDVLSPRVDKFKTELCPQYVFAELLPKEIRQLLNNDEKRIEKEVEERLPRSSEKFHQYKQVAMRPASHDVQDVQEEPKTSESPLQYHYQSIYKIWPDFDIEPQLTRTNSTIKADAARASFSATGKDIVWAVIDSGIDFNHEHFKYHRNLDLQLPLRHADFTKNDDGSTYLDEPSDEYGHGTHVAGIIAGEIPASRKEKEGRLPPLAVTRMRDKSDREHFEQWEISQISGIAPECKLLSLRVLDKRGRGNSKASNILAALAYINKLNEFGRNILIHGVNLSVGYQFDAEWFGCGKSPLCVEVDRLVRSGVVVVTSAGNTGYGAVSPSFDGPNMAGLSLTINDPGNADLAVTVGSTHRYMPLQYGVSYFSSKGPTGDGRLKPDLVAPGENVLSCAAGQQWAVINKKLARQQRKDVAKLPPDDESRSYLELSGTSMAAPHVSGAIAAFLSISPGFKGSPDKVKEIFLSTATDLGRERYMQGHGLVDLMRAIQSV